MGASCAIRGCKARHTKFSTLKFFCVPYNKQRRIYWLSKCPFLRNYNDKQLDNLRICSKHFYPHDISADLKLTVDAVPTLHLPPTDIFETTPLNVKVLRETNENQLTLCTVQSVQSTPESLLQPQSNQSQSDSPFQNIELLTSQQSSDPISLICHETLIDTSRPPTPSLSQVNTLIASQPLSCVASIHDLNQILNNNIAEWLDLQNLPTNILTHNHMIK